LFAWWDEVATMNRAAVREVADLYYARFEARLEKGLAEVRSEMASGLANQRADLIKWMFIFWIGTMVPLAGVVIALIKL
jgi:hypothetical protein